MKIRILSIFLIKKKKKNHVYREKPHFTFLRSTGASEFNKIENPPEQEIKAHITFQIYPVCKTSIQRNNVEWLRARVYLSLSLFINLFHCKGKEKRGRAGRYITTGKNSQKVDACGPLPRSFSYVYGLLWRSFGYRWVNASVFFSFFFIRSVISLISAAESAAGEANRNVTRKGDFFLPLIQVFQTSNYMWFSSQFKLRDENSFYRFFFAQNFNRYNSYKQLEKEETTSSTKIVLQNGKRKKKRFSLQIVFQTKFRINALEPI